MNYTHLEPLNHDMLTPQLVEFVESFFGQPKGFVDDAMVAKKLMILDSCLGCGLDERGVIHKA